MNVSVTLAPQGVCASNLVHPEIEKPKYPIAYLARMNEKGSTDSITGSGVLCSNGEEFAIGIAKIGGEAAIYRGWFRPAGAVAVESYGNDAMALSQIPAVEMEPADFDKLYDYLIQGDSSTYVDMQLRSTVNPWLELFSSPQWYFMQGVVILVGLGVLKMIRTKWIIFITDIDQGLKPSIAQCIFALQLFGNVEIIVFGMDPFGKHGFIG